MMVAPVDIIIPLRAVDFDRFEISLASYRHFWKLTHHISLFCRPEEKDEAARRFKAEDVSVFDKREICGPAWDIKRGWFRAQVVKMAAAKTLDGDFYLPSDPDIIVTREVTPATFFRDGRAPYYPERTLDQSVTPHEPDRFYSQQAIDKSWKPFCERLGFQFPERLVPRMVTPLSVQTARLSTEKLAEILGVVDWREAWRELCQSMRPSDFALYYLVGKATGNLAHFHYEQAFLGKNIRTIEEGAAWRPEECFRDGHTWFAIAVESKSGVSPEELRIRLRSWIPGLERKSA